MSLRYCSKCKKTQTLTFLPCFPRHQNHTLLTTTRQTTPFSPHKKFHLPRPSVHHKHETRFHRIPHHMLHQLPTMATFRLLCCSPPKLLKDGQNLSGTFSMNGGIAMQ